MIKSKKQILEKLNEELPFIRTKNKIEEKFLLEETWYEKMGLGSFEKKVEKYDITEKEVLEKLKICEMIDKKNGIFDEINIKKLPKLYVKLLEMSNELKDNKRLYSWYMELLKTPIGQVTREYEMDHIMILEYLLKNRKIPSKKPWRDQRIMAMASYYYILKKYKKDSSHWLSQLARAFMMGT